MIVDIQEIVEKYLNETLSGRTNYDKVEEILEILFSSIYHFPKMMPKLYFKLDEKNNKSRFLSNIATHNLKVIYNNYLKVFTELQNIPCLLKIIEKSEKKIIFEEIEYKGSIVKIIILSLDKIEKTYFEQAHILVENLIDADIYLHLSKIYLSKKNLGILELKLYPINGGGNQTYNQYRTSFKIEKKIGICITDSDKSHPNSEYGNTTKKILNEKDEDSFSQIFILENQRELENFIPIEFLEYIYGSTSQKKFDNYLGNIDKQFYNFIDYKKGISVFEFKDFDFFNFWKEIISIKKINCSFSLKVDTSQEKDYYFDNIYELRNFLQETPSLVLKPLKNIFICEGYGNDISKDFYKILIEREKELESQKNSIEKSNSLSIEKIEEKKQEIQNKIEYYQKIQDKIFDNNNLIDLLNNILLWGVNVRNIQKKIL